MPQEFDPQKELNEQTLREVEDYLKLPITNKERNYKEKECEHMRVVLDDQNKTVTCRDCKKVLDPFWYLQLLAKEWSIRRYQDAEAIKAYRTLKQQRENAQARGKYYIRPESGDGQKCWDSYEAYYGHPPEYIYYSRGWYAGEDSGCESIELFDFTKQQLAARADRYRTIRNDFIEQLKKTNNFSEYVAKTIYAEAFKNGRDYERNTITQ